MKVVIASDNDNSKWQYRFFDLDCKENNLKRSFSFIWNEMSYYITYVVLRIGIHSLYKCSD